jgi:hypothetical protein
MQPRHLTTGHVELVNVGPAETGKQTGERAMWVGVVQAPCSRATSLAAIFSW